MAALSDYLESGLLTHIFKGSSFPKPTQIAIALTSGVPLESDNGSTIPELPSGVSRGVNFISTNYSRINLGNPSVVGNTVWNNVGTDNITAYTVSGTSATGVTVGLQGYYYPLYLNIDRAKLYDPNTLAQSYKFVEYPGVTFYAPLSLQQSGMATNPGYTIYQGNGFIKNSTQVVFPTALTDWGWVSGIAIVDTSNYASGNLLMYAKLDNPRYVYTGDNIKFDSNSLEISLN
jgi:hypothetical protein